MAEQDRRVALLELRLTEAEEAARRAREQEEGWWGWTRRLHFTGYAQPQLLWQWLDSSASLNLVNGQLPPGIDSNSIIAKGDPLYANGGGNNAPGLTTNRDAFRLRRTRLKVELEPTDFARFVFEIDPIAAGGPDNGTGTIARNVEAQGIARWCACGQLETTFGMGIFKIPFGWEVLQSDTDRPFIERSWWEQNTTPGEFDTGIKAYTKALDGRLAFQVALVNGNMLGEKTFALQPDLNKGKDGVGRVNFDFGPFDLGASGYYGQGQEVSLASLSFKQFTRAAFNVEARVHHSWRHSIVGETRVLAEFDRGQNMDRGVQYAASVALPGLPADVFHGDVVNRDELGYWARIEQDITRWATLGFRYDYYSPDSAQATNGRDTYAVVGVAHFGKPLQLMVEYDHFIDNAHAPGAAPAGKHGDVVSTVLQVRYP